MKNLQLFLITLITQKCCSEFIPVFQHFAPLSAPLVPMCPPAKHQTSEVFHKPVSDKTAAPYYPNGNLKFLLPFLDIEIQSDRNLHVAQDPHSQQIFILNGHNLYQLFVERQEKRLVWIGDLAGSVRHVEPLTAEIIKWQGSFLLLIALEEYLEVYQLGEDSLLQRADAVKDPAKANEPPPVFEAIQQLTLTGRFHKLFLFSPSEERIMIVAAVNFNKLYGKLRIFEWFNTYFDPIEEITVPAMHVVKIIGSQTKYLITGRIIKHQPRSILNVYEISRNSIKLSMKQTLTIQSRVVHIFSYLNRNIIVACSTEQQKCNSFHQMPDGYFGVYRQRTPKEFAFDKLSSTTRFIAASRQNQIMVFINHRLDCFGSFISDRNDITSLMGLQNSNNETYLLLVYNRPFEILVRLVELEINVKNLPTDTLSQPEESILSSHHQHIFEQTIGQLRSLLLRRKSDMDIFRKLSRFLKPKLKAIETNDRTVLHAGNVGVIRIVGESLRSPTQVVQKIESLREIYLHSRSKRSEEQKIFNVTTDVRNRIRVKKMKVENLLYDGDVIEGFILNLTNPSNKVLNITTKVITHFLNTSELILQKYIRTTRQQTIPDIFFDSVPSVRVKHLKVDFINGQPWNAFYDSVFLKSRDKVIEGNLILQSSVKVEHLTTTIINGLVVSNLFNLKQPQIIHSDLVLSQFFVNDLNANTINGLKFEEDIVFNGNDTFIETPVIIYHLRISGDVLLDNNIKIQHKKPDEIEFHQFYTGKVIVNGSLVVNNVKSVNNGTKIILEDDEFNENKIKEKYLLKEEAQNFSFPVVFENTKVTAPSLETAYLNDYPTDQHMLVNKLNSQKPFKVLFMQALVKGDVIVRDYNTIVAKIKNNIIHPGDKVNITGHKIFEAPLEIINAQVTTLNEVSATDLILKDHLNTTNLIRFGDTKAFTKIKVKNNTIIDRELKVSYLNNLPLENLLNYDYHTDRLKIDHLVHVTNLVFHKINGIPFEDFFMKLDVHDGRLVLNKDLIVDGSVQFAHGLNVVHINDRNWNEYVNNLVRVNENAVIEGEVSFIDDLTITKQFDTLEINGDDLENILKNVLMKSQAQLITGKYRFDNIRGTNVNTFHINNIDVGHFVDLSKNFIEIESDVIVENLYIEGNLQGSIKEFEFLSLVKDKIQQLPFQPYKNLYVLKNVSWPSNVPDNGQHEFLQYFYKSAVLANRNQIISGNLKMSNPVIKNVQTRFKFPSNLDFEFILQDAVLKNSAVKQIISGKKTFLDTLHMETLKAFRNVDAKLLNNIDILRFNRSLYRTTSPALLQGPMKFIKPLTIKHLIINGLINGWDSSGIYQLPLVGSLPAVQLRQLMVEDSLTINNINDMNWSYFLNNRITLRGPALEHFGHLTFEHLIIEKHALLKSINGIPVDNLVFKNSPHLQTITGHKLIQNALVLDGPAHVMRINDQDINALYRKSLHKDQNYEFKSLVLKQVEFERGLQLLDSLDKNEKIKQRSFGETDELDSFNNLKFLKFLIEFQENFNNSSLNIIYLDYDLNATVKWLDSKDHITANQTIYHELSRISYCEKRYIQISLLHQSNNVRIYLKSLSSKNLAQSSNNISIKAENFCSHQKRKMKSKITVTDGEWRKVFGWNRFIETLYIFDNIFNPLEKFVILHALELPNLKRNEIRIIKISSENNSRTIHDWQHLKQYVGLQLKYFKLSKMHILVTNGFVEHYSAVTIYHFQNDTQLFKVQQVIEGNFDIIEILEMPKNQATKQLILSCAKCKRIFIYECVNSRKDQKYEIQQIISLKSFIDKLVIFKLKKSFYMLVISQPGYGSYNLYKYSYIQGWLPITFGYFPNLKLSLPLTELWTKYNSLMLSKVWPDLPLMLLCQPNNCYVVKAIV